MCNMIRCCLNLQPAQQSSQPSSVITTMTKCFRKHDPQHQQRKDSPDSTLIYDEIRFVDGSSSSPNGKTKYVLAKSSCCDPLGVRQQPLASAAQELELQRRLAAAERMCPFVYDELPAFILEKKSDLVFVNDFSYSSPSSHDHHHHGHHNHRAATNVQPGAMCNHHLAVPMRQTPNFVPVSTPQLQQQQQQQHVSQLQPVQPVIAVAPVSSSSSSPSSCSSTLSKIQQQQLQQPKLPLTKPPKLNKAILDELIYSNNSMFLNNNNNNNSNNACCNPNPSWVGRYSFFVVDVVTLIYLGN